ncbi:MAG: hypothetical protein AAF799_20635 [Myxococcota bacterium]
MLRSAVLALALSTAFAPRANVSSTSPRSGRGHLRSQVTYAMSHSTADYDTNAIGAVGNWDHYGYKWKSLHDTNVGAVLHGSQALHSLPYTPRAGVESGLNVNETHAYTNTMGGQYDAAGSWHSRDIDDPMTGLVFAALVMHYFDSPVLLSGAWTPPKAVAPSGTWYQTIALESLVFEVPGASSLHAACGLNPAATPVQAAASLSSCNLSSGKLVSATASLWVGANSPSGAPDFMMHRPLSGAALLDAYAAGFSYGPTNPSGQGGEMVFSAPDNVTPQDIAALVTMAGVIAADLEPANTASGASDVQ